MASTTDTESAQALFCALADFVSAKNVNNILSSKQCDKKVKKLEDR